MSIACAVAPRVSAPRVRPPAAAACAFGGLVGFKSNGSAPDTRCTLSVHTLPKVKTVPRTKRIAF